MTRTRVYTDQPLAAGVSVELGEDAAHHVSSVLRLRCGDPLVLFDGKGAECRGVIDRIGKRQVAVRIETHALIDRESPLKVTLAQGISRGERMDYTIQKAVELGVAAIAPLNTQRSTVKLDAERTEKRLAHWRKVMVSACEQCGRNHLPALMPVQNLPQWLAQAHDELKIVLRGGAETPLTSLSPPQHGVTMLIGPEGGLDETEIRAAEQARYRPVRLGPRILRTETAAVTALAAMQAIWGDFR